MLLDTFPGLEESDFDGVATGVESEEGEHTYIGGELRWERTSNQPITSAEKTVTRAGYKTLLHNLSERLTLPVSTVQDAVTVINTIDTPGLNGLILNCQQDIPREKIDDLVLNKERGTVTVYWWDDELQDNISLILPYQLETNFSGCSESVRNFLRHLPNEQK